LLWISIGSQRIGSAPPRAEMMEGRTGASRYTLEIIEKHSVEVLLYYRKMKYNSV